MTEPGAEPVAGAAGASGSNERDTAIPVSLRFGVTMLVVVFALMFTAQVAPAAFYCVPKSVACPSDTRDVFIVTHAVAAGRGRSLKWDVYCENEKGISLSPSTATLELFVLFESLIVGALAGAGVAFVTRKPSK